MLETRTVPSYTLPLVNQTGLDAGKYSIYVLGFSTASQMELQSNGTFAAISQPSGSIPSFTIGTGAGQLQSITLDANTPLIGARLYFFVAPPNMAPSLPFTGSGANVTQPQNPPTSNYPPFDIVEITVPSGGGLPTIDVQTVDGFIFPLTLTLNDNLGQVGQPLPINSQNPVVTREAVFTAYTSFMNNQGPDGAAYLPLVFGPDSVAGQPGGILNPGLYLASGANPSSALNSVWNATLTTLFASPSTVLSMAGDDGVTYTGVPTTVGSHNVLQFTGGGHTFNIYSPLTPDPLGSYQTNETAGEMVFANDGVFADASANVVISGPASVALALQRDIAQALNRGVAISGPNSGTPGYTSVYWGTETNWYPAGQTQNLFSRFMHTGQVRSQPIFVQAANAVADAQGAKMGQAYGFGFDETPGHVNLLPPGTPVPNVPSKFDPVPAGTTTVTITLGPWSTAHLFAVGVDNGGAPGVKVLPRVRVYDSAKNLVASFFAFPPSSPLFHRGVRVATGDVNADGTDDVIVAAGPAGKTLVKVIDGTKFDLLKPNGMIAPTALLRNFFAYPGKKVGVFVDSADVDADGHDDIVTGADAGWKPVVKIFSGMDGTVLGRFDAYAANFRGGVRVAVGDINKDGHAEIVTGKGRGSLVTAWDGSTLTPLHSFNAYPTFYKKGVFVALGDVQGDGGLEIITGTDSELPRPAHFVGPQVRIYEAATGNYLDQFFADADTRFLGGISVGVFTGEILTGHAQGKPSLVSLWNYGTSWLQIDAVSPFGAFLHGVFVG